MADIHFPAYLQVSKDCLYHNTCVLITALLTEIIFLQRILQECFLLPNNSLPGVSLWMLSRVKAPCSPLSPEGFYYGKKKSPSQQLCSHSFIAKGFSYIKGEYENLIERKGDGKNLSLSFAYMDIIHHDY